MKNKTILGDCESVLKKATPDSIDLIITDVPYGIDYKSNRQGRSGHSGFDIKTDRKDYFEKINGDKNVPVDWLKEAYKVLKNNSAIYIFIHWSTWSELESSVKDAGFKVKNMIVINKSNHGMGDLKGDYAPKHELVLYATKGRHVLNFPNGRKNNVMDLPIKYSGAIRLHPNEKPISWAEVFVLESSKENGIVLDPFMGSGFVGKASLKNGRFFIGIENDEKHFEVANKSIIDFCEKNGIKNPFEV